MGPRLGRRSSGDLVVSFSRIAWVALLVGLLAGAAWGSVSAQQRTDVVDENYLTGYLAWVGGKGVILWDPSSSPADNVDPGATKGGVDEFVSQPLPRTLYLNVSRSVQTDLFFEGSSAVPVDIELHADRSFFTGGTARNTHIGYCSTPGQPYCADPNLRPTAPGYAVTSHRMHAELDTLPKGGVIRLKVIHLGDAKTVYGLAADHASVLRISLFSPEEALYRIPRYAAPTLPTQPTPPAAALDPLSELLGALVPGGAAAVSASMARSGQGSRRRRGLVVCALMVGVATLAGCVGSGDTGPKQGPASSEGLGGSAESYVVRDEANESGLADSVRGSIYGVVSDPDNLPVNGAFVLLLETSHSTRTDHRGRFQFRDLAPGEYRLRVDRDGFLPLEATARVEPASITKIEMTLEWVHVKHVDFRPHRHDYWQGKESITLVDEPGSRASLPPPLLILPGTVDIEVNVTWTGGKIGYVWAGRPDDANGTFLYPRASGVAYHLRTTWEMTDPGHSLYTYWRPPGLYSDPVPQCSRDLYVATIQDPQCVEPNYRIRVTIHKGVVPLEPAHPDRWGAEKALTVLNDQKTTLASQCAAYTVWQLIEYQLPIGGCPLSTRDGVNPRAYNSSWRPMGFVPFETQLLEIHLHASRAVIPQTSPTPWALFVADARWPAGEAGRWAASPATPEATNLNWTWRIPIETEMADPPYAPYGNWYFFVAPTDQNAQVLDDYANLGSLPSLFLTVIAHKELPAKPA